MKYCKVLINNPLDQVFTYSFDSDQEVEFGKRVEVNFGNKKNVKACVVEILDEIEKDINYKIKKINKVLDKKPIFTQEQYKLSIWIAKFYLCSCSQALFSMIPSNILTKEIEFTSNTIKEEKISLNKEQEQAVNTINNSLDKEFYLFGVTGSGKTHVCFEVAKNIIKQNKQVIYLVPEITLTHQVVKQAKKHFKDIAIIHSKLTPKNRLIEYEKIKNNKASFIIGARSAIFSPTSNLGLIIIDEEHETTYKSGNTPRYHARQVAQKKLQLNKDCKLLLSSATPSLEAYKLIKEKKLNTIYLLNKACGDFKAKVEVVDMKNEDNIISRQLYKQISLALSENRQSILFLNRRGFSYYWHCDSCNSDLTCPNCSVKLTMHKKDNKMVCHYCGYKTNIVDICPTCNSTDFKAHGIGTEKVEENIKTLFPGAKILRLDTDSVKNESKETQRLLKEFQKGEYDILLGTQMVAKGLNFPKVKVVGIISADTGFHLPDFRANERNFSLLLQVSGRTSRYNNDGVVIIQANDVDNKVLKDAINNDVKNYYETELEERNVLEFPPFSRIIRFVVRSKNEEDCIKEVNNLEKWTNSFLESKKLDCQIMGVSPCPIEKINNNFRYQLILTSYNFKDIQIVAMTIFKNYNKISNRTYIENDVDPIVLL